MFQKTMRMANVFSNKEQVLYYLIFSIHSRIFLCDQEGFRACSHFFSEKDTQSLIAPFSFAYGKNVQ